MASPTRHLQRISPLTTMIRTRRFFSTSSLIPLNQLAPVLVNMNLGVSPSVVALLSYFAGPESREIPHSAARGTAVFVDRTLIVTSARSVGRVSTFYDSERSSVLHNCFIGRTIALTAEGKLLRTTPVAVNFAGDLAVLEVDEAEAHNNLPPPLPIASVLGERSSPLLVMSRHQNCSVLLSLPIPSPVTAVRSKAPWPLEEKLGWVGCGISKIVVKTGTTSSDKGTISHGRGSKDAGDVYSLPEISGSPCFNSGREVVGITSWTAAAEEDGVAKSYWVPPSRIKSIIDYAKTKGPHDPVVMDRWIDAHTIADHKLDICEECVPSWPMGVLNYFAL